MTNQTATYLADPEDVHRVLLLYSGGLDTSVMLKWIQDQYDAEALYEKLAFRPGPLRYRLMERSRGYDSRP